MSDSEEREKEKKGFLTRSKDSFKNNLLAGVLFLVPLVATFFFLRMFIGWIDQVLLLLPVRYRPENLFPVHIPGLGLILLIFILLSTGLVVRNFLGRKLVNLWEGLLYRIPFVNKFYRAVKQLVETIVNGGGKDFKRVVLVQYPKNGVYALGYVTGVATGEVQRKTQKKVLNIFVPTTPNPTSGYYVMVPEDEVIPLDMNVEDSFKLLISGGIIAPDESLPNNNKKNCKRRKINDQQ